jgi:hypothetical protein
VATRPARPTRVMWLVLAVVVVGASTWELRYGDHASVKAQSCLNSMTIAVPSLLCLLTGYRSRKVRRTATAWQGIGIGWP